MTALIIKYLPWLLSGITIWMNILAGNLHKSAWLIGLVGQVLWLIWIVGFVLAKGFWPTIFCITHNLIEFT